jgi:hypothetical protein
MTTISIGTPAICSALVRKRASRLSNPGPSPAAIMEVMLPAQPLRLEQQQIPTVQPSRSKRGTRARPPKNTLGRLLPTRMLTGMKASRLHADDRDLS